MSSFKRMTDMDNDINHCCHSKKKKNTLAKRKKQDSRTYSNKQLNQYNFSPMMKLLYKIKRSLNKLDK